MPQTPPKPPEEWTIAELRATKPTERERLIEAMPVQPLTKTVTRLLIATCDAADVMVNLSRRGLVSVLELEALADLLEEQYALIKIGLGSAQEKNDVAP